MDAQLQALETQTRASDAYQEALRLLAEEATLQARLREIERQLDAFGVAGKLARIDHLRAALAGATRNTVLAG